MSGKVLHVLMIAGGVVSLECYTCMSGDMKGTTIPGFTAGTAKATSNCGKTFKADGLATGTTGFKQCMVTTLVIVIHNTRLYYLLITNIYLTLLQFRV